MDLRLFELFCRVYKERSFSRAARELSLTQPTISTHIKELEDALGTQLFNRAGREIQPTEAGHFLYEHAKSLLTLRRSLIEKTAVFLKRVGSMGAIKQAVKEGHGVSFVSELAIASERRAGEIQVARVRELGQIRRTYHTAFNRRRVLSPVTHAFLEYLRRSSGGARVAARHSGRSKAKTKTAHR